KRPKLVIHWCKLLETRTRPGGRSPGRDYAAITAVQIAEIVVGRPGQLPDLELVLSGFRCELNSADRDSRRVESLEAQHRSDPLFHATVILLDSIIEILV